MLLGLCVILKPVGFILIIVIIIIVIIFIIITGEQ